MLKATNANNSLATIKQSFLVVLDSRNATTFNNGSYNSDVMFDFECAIAKPTHCLLMTCSVLQFSCPNSIYNINETNNFLHITENLADPTGVTEYTIYISYGNYNVNTFMSTLAGLLDRRFTISFNKLNNKLTLSNSTNEFTIKKDSTLYYVMGFDRSTQLQSVNKVYNMPYTCNFNGIQSFNILMPSLNIDNLDSYNKSFNSIIQPIPIDAAIPQISYIKTNDYAFTINQDTIDNINIKISDDMETLVNFNNQHWNLTLCFETISDVNRFDYENTFDNILKYGYE